MLTTQHNRAKIVAWREEAAGGRRKSWQMEYPSFLMT